jgi:hypothetical protein
MERTSKERRKVNLHKVFNWLILGLFMVTCTSEEIQPTTEVPCNDTITNVQVVDSINYITKYKTVTLYREVPRVVYDTIRVTVYDTIQVKELTSINITDLMQLTPCDSTTTDTIYINCKDGCRLICKIRKLFNNGEMVK